MKTSVTNSIILGCLGLAIATLLPGCVEPYGTNYGTAYGVTAYRPGYEVRVLPSGYRTEIIGGTHYYYHNGVYYRSRSGHYVVVEAPRSRYESPRPPYNAYSRYERPDEHREVIITRLPHGYHQINTPSGRYYQHNGVYYQKRGNGYVIVSRPY